MLNYKRSIRVGELVQQEISKIVQELKEPGLGFITITGIKMTDDLLSARVFYSVIGSEEEIKRSSLILEDSVPVIRHQLALKLNLRRTPALKFEFDDTPTRANRIFELLEQIKKEESDTKIKPTNKKKKSIKK